MKRIPTAFDAVLKQTRKSFEAVFPALVISYYSGVAAAIVYVYLIKK